MTTSQVTKPSVELSKPSVELIPDPVGEVAVLTAAGPLDAVATELDRSILLALSEEPRGVVCDLSHVVDGDGVHGPDVLVSCRQARAWPGVPVAMACPDASVRTVLRRHPMTDHVAVRSTLAGATAHVEGWTPPTVVRTRLAPRATASREARDFVNRACLDWGLRHEVASVSLVVSELVTNALLHAEPAIDLSLAHHGELLRLAVRDRSDRSPRLRGPGPDRTTGRGLALVESLSRGWGVLPTTDGGKVVWAVLEI